VWLGSKADQQVLLTAVAWLLFIVFKWQVVGCCCYRGGRFNDSKGLQDAWLPTLFNTGAISGYVGAAVTVTMRGVGLLMASLVDIHLHSQLSVLMAAVGTFELWQYRLGP
jgi:hypothetical protein